MNAPRNLNNNFNPNQKKTFKVCSNHINYTWTCINW